MNGEGYDASKTWYLGWYSSPRSRIDKPRLGDVVGLSSASQNPSRLEHRTGQTPVEVEQERTVVAA